MPPEPEPELEPRLQIIKVVREDDLRSQIGKDGHYFDLVDFSRIRAFHVPKQLAEEFGPQVQCQRLWLWAQRQNGTFRPGRPLSPREEKLPLYDPEQTQLRYVGMLFVKALSRPSDILPSLRSLAGFPTHEEIELYEEIKFEPVMCEAINIHDTFRYGQIQSGDIICYQKSPKPENRYPSINFFFQHVHDQKEVQRKVQALEEEVLVLKRQACLEKKKANMEYDELKLERDNAVRQVDELRDQNRHAILEFSLEDLEQATEHLSDVCKVGDTEYGRVYKGIIHKTTVAIKLSCSQSLFQQEVSILRKCRHPNIVSVVGVCSEASALVYEWLPNGSLEDFIVSTNNSPPLSWRNRAQIIGDVCCTLLFLHSNKPSALVHGDLRPGNILIDANYRSKLFNFGMSNLFLAPGTCPPNLTARLPYMDPEFLTTGELTPLSDIYSLGVIILRLLTGMPPLSIAKKVAAALETDTLHLMIDKSAGEWPYTQAKQLAILGLSCVEMTREKRPDLLTKVWKGIEPMVTRPFVPYFHSASEGSCAPAPAHFFCPISMEIMKDPQVASDGFTYEAEAIKHWLDLGNNRSPMTNLKLPNEDLVPNHALRSCIQEFLELQRQRGHIPDR
ncbi:hypothetical protein U9M48_007704 [Paspalum notatum var. saurae]|uniref:RING-type E3 ubiquitin transferase n=1 Tax=Paspalum notatum var. saurae TaxID=547442 RepID=A0AAQ3SMQ3_PASNO